MSDCLSRLKKNTRFRSAYTGISRMSMNDNDKSVKVIPQYMCVRACVCVCEFERTRQ
jgi:hypothetical protein